MLTRLRISGFKNLIDVDLSFGPFTCIAGGNAVGKSNLFDAIMFMSSLADMQLIEAAMIVRDDGGRSNDVRSLFHAMKRGKVDRMRFEAEMIVPEKGNDDLGQKAEASITFLRYIIEISYKPSGIDDVQPGLELKHESLEHINIRDAARHLPFPHSPRWRRSVVRGRRSSPFISTATEGEERTIKLHQEGGGGRVRSFLASSLPRTVLSTVNAAESPTAVLARREMQSWRLLQLEPSALRAPDQFTAPSHLGSNGAHLPSTLFALHRRKQNQEDPASHVDVYARVGNRLAELVEDVRRVYVERDDRRELLTLFVEGKDGMSHPARALSDGTLRFLALAVLDADPSARGVLCFEEPENGIHPERIVAMLKLLQDLAMDPFEEAGEDNPLRQVIINTHSPTVVAEVADESLLLAERMIVRQGSASYRTVAFRPLDETWRVQVASSPTPVQRGRILAFLNPLRDDADRPRLPRKGFLPLRRVIERPDLKGQLSLWARADSAS